MATESWTPNRHQVDPTQDFTFRAALPYAWPDSNPASTRIFQMSGTPSRAPKRSMRAAPVSFTYRPNCSATCAITASFCGVISPPGMRGTTE